jgi:hypothetical protein
LAQVFISILEFFLFLLNKFSIFHLDLKLRDLLLLGLFWFFRLFLINVNSCSNHWLSKSFLLGHFFFLVLVVKLNLSLKFSLASLLELLLLLFISLSDLFKSNLTFVDFILKINLSFFNNFFNSSLISYFGIFKFILFFFFN